MRSRPPPSWSRCKASSTRSTHPTIAGLVPDATGAGDGDEPVRLGGGWGDATVIAQAGGGSPAPQTNGMSIYVHQGAVDFRPLVLPNAPPGPPPVINVLQAGQGAAI